MSDFLPPDRNSIFYHDSQKYLPKTPQVQPYQNKDDQYQKKSNPAPLNLQSDNLSAEQLAKEGFFPIGGVQNNKNQFPYVETPAYIPVLESTPSATSTLVLGIVGLLFSIAFCKWYNTIPALISCCLAIYLANSGIQMVESSPNIFSRSGLGNLRAGKVMGIIGMCFCGISFLALIIYYARSNE